MRLGERMDDTLGVPGLSVGFLPLLEDGGLGLLPKHYCV
jgi:hypothetical protein